MKAFTLASLFCLAALSVHAATISSTGAGGDWSVGTTWVGGVVPVAGDDVIIVSGATVTLSTNQACAALTLNGSAILNFSTNSRTLTVNGTMTMNGTSQVTGNNNNRILSLQGDFNIPAGQTGSIGGVRVAQVITGTFNLAGTFTPTDNTGTKTFGNAILTDGCLIDASVTEAITIAGNLSVIPGTPGQHSKIGRISITVTGTTLVTGYLEFANSGAGTKTFNNTITVAAGGTWDNIIGEDPVINCSIVNDGVWPQPTGGNGRYDVNVAGTYTYSGTREIAFTRLRIQSAATVTNKGSLLLTMTGNQALTVNSGGIFNNGDGISSATLTFTAYTTVVNLGGGGSVVNFANANNTVVYSSSNNQNVYATTYDRLVCSGNNTATIGGATTVNTSLSISGSTIVDVTGGTDLSGTGTLTMTGTSLLRISSAGTVPALTGAGHSLAAGTTIEFYRAGAQTAASSANYPYQNVLISGNAGSAVNFNSVSSIAGDLTLTNAGTFTNGAGTPPLITVAGAFSYGSTATTTLNTNLAAGNVTLSSTGGFTFSNRTITINQNDGFWAVTGTPVITQAGTAQVVFTTGTNQQISGTTAPTFNRLVINNNNDVTLNVSTATVTGTLTLTNGRLITGSNTVVMASGSSVARTNGFVEGNLNKAIALGTSTTTYEVGTNADYTPASITCTSVTTAGTLTVSSVDGDHPEINSGLIEPNNTVNRYWSIANNGIVFSTLSTGGQISGSFTWVNGDEDPLLDNSAILKWYNNSTLTWTGTDQLDQVAEQNPPMTVTTNIATNLCTFTILDPSQLPTTNRVDFQVGEKVDPTYVYNRLTGANNWNNLATWIQQRSGVISLTNGSGTITGASTTFATELVVGDKIMLIADPATVYTVTSIGPGQTLTVGPAVPSVTTSGGYGRQYIPGINSPTSDVDAVVIGNTNIADAGTTITLDIDAQILTLDVGSTARTTAQVLTHQNSTRDLVVLANANVNQPSGAASNIWNINDGTANVLGDVTIGSAVNTVTRVSRINITTGTLSAGNLKFRPFIGAGREVQTILNISGAGTVNLLGALTFNGNRGTLSSAAGSTFNFVRSASGQTITVPSSSTGAWVYANIHANNTSAAGVAFGFTSSATSVTGNVRVQTGLMTVGNFDIVGAAGSTFQVANGATFEMRSGAGGGTGSFPSGFGTISLGATSTVAYNQTGNTNPWTIVTTTYGNLIVGQNGSTRNFQLANATTTVVSDLTVGSGTSTPTLRATGAATLTVSGNITINSLASLDASNITNLNVGGNWTDDGDFTESTNTVTFNSPAANVLQTLGGSVAETFNNLTINGSAATDVVRMTNNATVLNNLVLTQGGLELNGNTLTVSNSAVGAISRTSGYVKSESVTAPYGTLRWFINNTTGSHVYPFGVSSTQYIPVTLNVTVAGNRGVGSGYVPISTYATAATNPPGEYPSGVTNLNGTTGGASVTDRYWNITLGSSEFATTRPTSTVTFTALNTEKPTTWTAIGEPPTNPNQLVAQRWNTAAYWDPAQTSPAQSYTNNSPAAGTFQVAVPSVTNYSTSWTITDSSVPLPIELLSFTATVKNGMVELNWVTETEMNNDHFIVQRTSSGEDFEDVAKIKGKGTTTQRQRYSAIDAVPMPGRIYYRLKQTDFDGTTAYSKLVSVDVPDSFFRTVYPNPSTGAELNVALSLGDIGKKAGIHIVDVTGKEVYQSKPFLVESRVVQWQLSTALPAGIYFISIVLENEIKQVKLIVR
ncbi:MAG: T9SS type A sorting domain-containing protein [Cyclobacteriaceae bacterium]|nr:T9SS type A sorting domain-containing protein [Cyclobacteriaceae bacterium]